MAGTPVKKMPHTRKTYTIKIDKVCHSVATQLRGLMFSPKKTLLFVFKGEKRVTIHSWFVCYPITLIFLDKELKVVERAELRPWRVYTPKKSATYLIETPERINVHPSDTISIGNKGERNIKR